MSSPESVSSDPAPILNWIFFFFAIELCEQTCISFHPALPCGWRVPCGWRDGSLFSFLPLCLLFVKSKTPPTKTKGLWAVSFQEPFGFRPYREGVHPSGLVLCARGVRQGPVQSIACGRPVFPAPCPGETPTVCPWLPCHAFMDRLRWSFLPGSRLCPISMNCHYCANISKDLLFKTEPWPPGQKRHPLHRSTAGPWEGVGPSGSGTRTPAEAQVAPRRSPRCPRRGQRPRGFSSTPGPCCPSPGAVEPSPSMRTGRPGRGTWYHQAAWQGRPCGR